MNANQFKRVMNKISITAMSIICVMNMIFSSPALCQKERREIREGNKSYESGSYNQSETSYRKAIEKNQSSYPGHHNLGGALYRQKKYDEAIQKFQSAVNLSKTPKEKAYSLHNLGNSYVQAQKFGEAVDAYKEALKIKPDDDDTRYNLAYAKSMLKQQQDQQQQQQNKNEQKEQDKNQGQDSKQNDQNDQSQNQAQNEKQEEQKNQEQQNSQPRQKISREDAERILKALQNDEQQLQEKMHKKEGQKIRVEKDW
jgi:Ca-activated chloride channel homolog